VQRQHACPLPASNKASPRLVDRQAMAEAASVEQESAMLLAEGQRRRGLPWGLVPAMGTIEVDPPGQARRP
jgi:hypothetical protein